MDRYILLRELSSRNWSYSNLAKLTRLIDENGKGISKTRIGEIVIGQYDPKEFEQELLWKAFGFGYIDIKALIIQLERNEGHEDSGST